MCAQEDSNLRPEDALRPLDGRSDLEAGCGREALDAERELGMVGVRESLDVAKLFKTKSERWKYEREVRVIRPLEEADKVVLLENKEPRFSGSRLRNPSFAAGRFRRCAETPTRLRPRWIPTPRPYA